MMSEPQKQGCVHALPVCTMLGELVDSQHPQEPAMEVGARQGPSCTCPMAHPLGALGQAFTPSQQPGPHEAFGGNSKGACSHVMGGLQPLSRGEQCAQEEVGSNWEAPGPARMEGKCTTSGARAGLSGGKRAVLQHSEEKPPVPPHSLPRSFRPQSQPSWSWKKPIVSFMPMLKWAAWLAYANDHTQKKVRIKREWESERKA